MKRTAVTIGLLLLVGAIMILRQGGNEFPEVDHVEYLGQSIRMIRSAEAIAEGQDYPYDLDPAEVERVQRLVGHAPIANEFPSIGALTTAVDRLQFPGWELRQFGGELQADHKHLLGWGVQIPLTPQMRILVFRTQGGHYQLLDDFIDTARVSDHPWMDAIMGIVEESGQLVYINLKRERVATRPIALK